MMRRQFSKRRGFVRRGLRPAHQWLCVPGTTNFSSQTTGGALSEVFGFEGPSLTAGTALTSDPPEDQVIDRIMASIQVNLAGAGSWTLALLMADRTWTAPSGSTKYSDLSDKRILWSCNYDSNKLTTFTGFVSAEWAPPGHLVIDATTDLITQCSDRAVLMDIKPKIRIEDGKALYWLATEESGTASFSSTCYWFRMLLHRAGR